MERALPHNIDAECGVLGSVILDPEVVPQVVELLRPDDFYRDAHRLIYEAILILHARQVPADFVTLCDDMEKRGQLDDAGGASYLTSLVGLVPTSGNVEYYADIVAQKGACRRLIHTAGKIAALAYEEEENPQERAEQLIFALRRHTSHTIVPLEKVLAECLTELDALQQGEPCMLSIPTGFPRLDVVLGGGLQRSDLVILAARPGQGKTTLAHNIALHAALQEQKHVLFFSLEMSARQLALRLLAEHADEDQRRLRRGMIDNWERLVQAADALAGARLWFDDTPMISSSLLRSKARCWQTTHGLDLLIVDYVQLAKAIQGNGRSFLNREQEVAEISRSLKALAMELKIPVLALAQLNRGLEARQDRRPQLADLRESGALENDADVVLFIARKDQATGASQRVSDAEIIVAKHRNGPVGEIHVHFDPGRTRFTDLAAEP